MFPTAKATYEKKYLQPLAQEGYFVSILKTATDTDTIFVDCITYTTDHDTETGSSSLLRINYDEPHRDCGKCVACNSMEVADDSIYEWARGSTMCPLCYTWTKPWTMKSQAYRGLFKIIPDMPAEFIPSANLSGMLPMTSQHLIFCISDALQNASSEYFSYTVKKLAGWRQDIPSPSVKETVEFLSMLQSKDTNADIIWATPSFNIQETLRRAEAAGEAAVNEENKETFHYEFE
jgi:hypothetical protein